MNITFGYLKDFLAVFGFIIALFFIILASDLNQYKIHLIFICILGIIVDGVFSYLPYLHHNYIVI